MTGKVVFGATFSEYTKTTTHLAVDKSGGRMILSFSPPHSADVFNAVRYTISIDFDDMLMIITPLDSPDPLISQLGRSVDPRERMSMSWTWFWEDNDNVWRTYDKDCSVR